MAEKKTAVLLMGLGAPDNVGEVRDFYTGIHGGKPSEEMYRSVREHYEIIGGTSPLGRVTGEQAEALQEKLDRDHPGEYQVYLAFKYASPTIFETVDRIVADGYTKVVGLPLFPERSYASGDYHNRAETRLAQYPQVSYRAVRGWWLDHNLIQYWADRLKDEQEVIGRPSTLVILSSHSLQTRVVKSGDPYTDQAVQVAKAVAEAAGLDESKYVIAWQNGGSTPEEWVLPDINDVAKELIENQRIKTIVSGSLSFIADNLEVLFGVDVAFRKTVEGLGATLVRLPLPNTDPLLTAALEDAACGR
ncbi:ferrochelatase [Bifidobacterium sp. ESL0784]|uniref:ferrochelatase n=1 Tax=Bifidobacterium sp. ESL0784 TaxID=2983231 RepID=UPI0023F66E8D|nr:ferrochelatase [Bifidobacterium sp. ESL0784]MDF7641697.1 ferrochelatase [Bifidobacterium sp. ESL0784]